jgi:predicted DNA-binding transcriptional regulator AlpA
MRLLSKAEVAAMAGFHGEHLMRLARQGKFPKPIKFGASANCRVRFDAAEIETWLEARKSARQ